MNRLNFFKHFIKSSKGALCEIRSYTYPKRYLCDDKYNKNKTTAPFKSKYKVFKDEDSPTILDIEEERNKLQQEEEQDEKQIYQGISLTRGVTGVFDLEDLVTVLRQEATVDLFVAKMPKEYQYVDYIVVTSGISPRHLLATAELIRKLYKVKKHPEDLIPEIEGKTGKEWIALDLGNIALHLFSKAKRKVYDLETLWSVGREYDELSNTQSELDDYIQLIQSHSVYLQNLKPAS